MVYSGGYVVSILCGGDVLREQKDNSVRLQFNSEYTIRLQNKNDRRAVAKIFIDDENISEGGFVVNAHGSIDIERYASKARKLKLVPEESFEAECAGKGPRSDGANGVIRVEFCAEKPRPEYVRPYGISKITWPPFVSYSDGKPLPGGGVHTCGVNACGSPRGMSSGGEEKTSGSFSNSVLRSAPSPAPQPGVTVEGAHSSQRFRTVSMDCETQATIVTLKLVGQHEPIEVRQAYCGDCGAKPKRADRFCRTCGHQLS